MSLFDLSGKVAIITGSTRGIGRAIAVDMGRAGAKVVVSSRSAEDTARVAGELTGEGLDAYGVACDIGQKQQIDALVEATIKRWGRIDILVCNAGYSPYRGPLGGMSEEAFDEMVRINFKSNWWFANAVLPDMAKRKDGVFLITTSQSAFVASVVNGLYGALKSADCGLVRQLAAEWGPHNIRINSLAPGLIRTEFSRAAWDDAENLAKRQSAIPLRRIGDPEDLSGMAVALASRAGRFITGQTILVDGGATIL